jgi:hypothetical protein
MSMLYVHIHAAVNVHAAYPFPCCISHVQITCQIFHVCATCPCPCWMSNGLCPRPCCISQHYICFASKVVSFGLTETPKLAVSLFRETSQTNLFVSDNFETSSGSFGMNRVSYDSIAEG